MCILCKHMNQLSALTYRWYVEQKSMTLVFRVGICLLYMHTCVDMTYPKPKSMLLFLHPTQIKHIIFKSHLATRIPTQPPIYSYIYLCLPGCVCINNTLTHAWVCVSKFCCLFLPTLSHLYLNKFAKNWFHFVFSLGGVVHVLQVGKSFWKPKKFCGCLVYSAATTTTTNTYLHLSHN